MQDTVAEMAKNMKSNKTGATQASASELYDFMKRVRTQPTLGLDCPTRESGFLCHNHQHCAHM